MFWLMQVLVCPDSYGGTLSALAAATAISTGWRRQSPKDEVVIQPLSDGGPGLLASVAAALGGTMHTATVTGLTGEQVEADWLQVGDCAYIESAQACGRQLAPLPPAPLSATSRGVGELLAVALTAGCRQLVVGVGGTGSCDGGAGLLAALGATADGGRLDVGGGGLANLATVDLGPARERLAGVRIEVATDVDVPLTGPRGAAMGFAAQKGADPAGVAALEASLGRFASLIGRRSDGRDPAVMLGAGAGGGIGYALMALGAERSAGIERVMEICGFAAKVAAADLVVTGEGRLDWQSEQGKVVAGVAAAAAAAAKPVVALPGQLDLSKRECQALGLHGAYAVADLVGLAESLAAPADSLSRLAERVARTWGGR